MPKKVRAKEGDTLCRIATDNGLKDCSKLREDAANRDFLDRPLRAGDRITVPDIVVEETGGGVEQKHRFRRRGVPLPTIRAVHGSPDQPYQADPTLNHLNFSTFRTDRAGVDGTRPFPAGYGYHEDGHADLNAFKVEVEDRGAGGSVKVELEALKPIYDAAGDVTGHEPFTGAARAARRLEVTCNAVSGALPHVFRSPYLRLVADEADKNTVPNQTLLVTDLADGLGGDNDRMEILDQQVRVSIEYQTCNAATGLKCAASVDLPVGDDRKYVRLAIRAFRSRAGGSVVGGTTAQMLRRRTMKWFRRAYAPANLAPKLVAPEIEFIDPPPADMVVVCQDHGRTATGGSRLSFKLGDSPGAATGRGLLARIRRVTDPGVSIPLTAGMTPKQVGDAIVAAMPRGYSATAYQNARAFNAANGSCDVLIRKSDGDRVFVYNERTTDTRTTVAVARVDINSVASRDAQGALIPTTMDFRRVLRCAPPDDTKLDCFVVGAFDRRGLRGRAFVPATDLAAAFQPAAPLRWAAVMATTSSDGAVMDGSDNLPFTFPHEAGHVLCDAFHTRPADPNGPTELMSGTGTSPANAIDATKRICGGPYTVDYAMFDPAQNSPGDAHFDGTNAVDRFRNRGSNVLENW